VATVSSNGKVAYIYDQATDTWHPVAGSANTSQSYVWSGTHKHNNSVTFEQVVSAKAGINNFSNPAARDAAIPSPVNGTTVFLRTDSSGNQVNNIQYYLNGAWRVYGDNANLNEKTSSFTIGMQDSGKTIVLNSSSQIAVSVPTDASVNFPVGTQIAFIRFGSGEVVFAASDATATSLLSKNSNKKISAQYSQSLLIKKDANVWLLIGDLTA
jgi:hypothetical protein